MKFSLYHFVILCSGLSLTPHSPSHRYSLSKPTSLLLSLSLRMNPSSSPLGATSPVCSLSLCHSFSRDDPSPTLSLSRTDISPTRTRTPPLYPSLTLTSFPTSNSRNKPSPLAFLPSVLPPFVSRLVYNQTPTSRSWSCRPMAAAVAAAHTASTNRSVSPASWSSITPEHFTMHRLGEYFLLCVCSDAARLAVHQLDMYKAAVLIAWFVGLQRTNVRITCVTAVMCVQ